MRWCCFKKKNKNIIISPFWVDRTLIVEGFICNKCGKVKPYIIRDMCHLDRYIILLDRETKTGVKAWITKKDYKKFYVKPSKKIRKRCSMLKYMHIGKIDTSHLETLEDL